MINEMHDVYENEKIVLSSEDVFGMYIGDNSDDNIELQMCNCCQTCKSGKC